MSEAYIVTKPFKTRTRRLAVGDEITAADIDHAMSAEDWRERGFLAVKADEPEPEIEPARYPLS